MLAMASRTFAAVILGLRSSPSPRARCGVSVKTPAHTVATTTPFRPPIHALANQHLTGLFHDAFGLNVSEGAFLTRGLEKVRAEFSLTALAHNLRRALNIVGVRQ